MATTPANKQPLFIDRPLFAIQRLDRTTSPLGTVDPGTGSVAELLVDCTNNEGALIEELFLIQRTDSNVTAVNVYVSPSSLTVANGYFLARKGFPSSTPVGIWTAFTLPDLLSPVPHAVSGVAGSLPAPQFAGLRIQKGMALWAAAETSSPSAGAPMIAAQGGYY